MIEESADGVGFGLLHHAAVGPVNEDQTADLVIADLMHEIAVFPGTRIGRGAVEGYEDQLRDLVAQGHRLHPPANGGRGLEGRGLGGKSLAGSGGTRRRGTHGGGYMWLRAAARRRSIFGDRWAPLPQCDRFQRPIAWVRGVDAFCDAGGLRTGRLTRRFTERKRCAASLELLGDDGIKRQCSVR